MYAVTHICAPCLSVTHTLCHCHLSNALEFIAPWEVLGQQAMGMLVGKERKDRKDRKGAYQNYTR